AQRQSTQGNARPRQAHRKPEVWAFHAREVRGPVRDGSRRSDQPEARRQAAPEEGAAARRERRRSDGGLAAERRKRGLREDSEEFGQEAAQGWGRSEGNADADRRQEACEGGGGEEAGGQAAA